MLFSTRTGIAITGPVRVYLYKIISYWCCVTLRDHGTPVNRYRRWLQVVIILPVDTSFINNISVVSSSFYGKLYLEVSDTSMIYFPQHWIFNFFFKISTSAIFVYIEKFLWRNIATWLVVYSTSHRIDLQVKKTPICAFLFERTLQISVADEMS